MVRLGSHLSTAGGPANAVAEAERLALASLQIFTANQRQWNARPPDAEQVRAFRREVRRIGLKPVVSHAAYLINLASPDRSQWQRSVDALTNELNRCRLLGISDCVVHPGAHMGCGEKAGISRIISALDGIYDGEPDLRVRVLLETTAGQGNSIGHRFEHLEAIIKGSRYKRRLGVCIDTCHLHAAGYDITSPEGYESTMTELIRRVGRSRVRCIHLNDSKTPFASRVDRHEHIGRGTIGTAAFRQLVNDARFDQVPAILETPKGEDDKGESLDRTNLRRLRRMARKPSRQDRSS